MHGLISHTAWSFSKRDGSLRMTGSDASLCRDDLSGRYRGAMPATVAPGLEQERLELVALELGLVQQSAVLTRVAIGHDPLPFGQRPGSAVQLIGEVLHAEIAVHHTFIETPDPFCQVLGRR